MVSRTLDAPRSIIFDALRNVVAIFNVAILVTLKPLFLVRLNLWCVTSIGHLAGNTANTLAKLSYGHISENSRGVDLWFTRGKPANEALARITSRKIRRFHWPALYRTFEILEQFGLNQHILDSNNYVVDQNDLLVKSRNIFSFTRKEEEVSQCLVQRLGIPKGAKWVCVHIRDAAYDESRGDWWKDSRNNPANHVAEAFLPAAEYLAKCGYWVVRMGKKVNTPLLSSSPLIVDYANLSWKDDLLEIYLAANCEFMLSTPSGIDSVSHVWNRPMLCVNHPSWYSMRRFIPNSLHLLQNVVESSSGDLVSHSELKKRLFSEASSGVISMECAGLAYRKNTAKEILEATEEMVNFILSGSRSYGSEDNVKQAQFWRLFPHHPFFGEGVTRTRISRVFLQNNPQWLQ